jgi:hypothetical protein
LLHKKSRFAVGPTLAKKAHSFRQVAMGVVVPLIELVAD